MVTQTQIQSFYSSMSALANQAGAELGVDGSIILAQWANESAFGTSNLATKNNNFAGITKSGVEGQWASYSSPAQFEKSYVALIEKNFPSAENAGSNVNAFVTGLTQGPGGASYIGTESANSYVSKITNVQNTLAQAEPDASIYGADAVPSSNGTMSGAPALSGANSGDQSQTGNMGGPFDASTTGSQNTNLFGNRGTWTEMGISIAFVLGGLLLIVSSIYLLKTNGAGAITVSVNTIHGALKNG